MNTVAQKIKDAVRRKGFSTVKECAQALGLPYELLRKVVGEDHIPKDGQLIIYAKKMGMDPKDLLFTAYYQKAPEGFKDTFEDLVLRPALAKTNQIPLISWEELAVGTKNLRGQDSITTNLEGHALFAMTVQDNSMEPIFQIGEVLIINPDIKPEEGDYVVGYKCDEAFLRQLKSISRFMFLCPVNHKYDNIENTNDVKIMGKVIQKRMDFS
jgi:SOS-response transcriptional repressor LexA